MTQSEAGGFGWTQITGLVLGAVLVTVAFVILAWSNRRSRIARKERPPQTTKLLRPAGYSLHCWIDELNEKWNSAVIQSVAAGSVLGLLCSAAYPIIEGVLLHRVTLAQILAQRQSYLLWSLAAMMVSALAWLIANVSQAFRWQRSMRNCRFGLRGEQAVAEALADRAIGAAEYTVFHDVPGDGTWNIDHVVVGPRGIFVLETKTRARRKATRDQPEQEVHFDGERLQFPWCEDRRAAKQVQRNTEWLRQFVAGFAPRDMIIQPVILVPGWFVKRRFTSRL
jgi:hypothetical protein